MSKSHDSNSVVMDFCSNQYAPHIEDYSQIVSKVKPTHRFWVRIEAVQLIFSTYRPPLHVQIRRLIYFKFTFSTSWKMVGKLCYHSTPLNGLRSLAFYITTQLQYQPPIPVRVLENNLVTHSTVHAISVRLPLSQGCNVQNTQFRCQRWQG